MTSTYVLNEVTNGHQGDWRLCFQRCAMKHDNGATEEAYRFIWRSPDDSPQSVKGRAQTLPSHDMYELMQLASVDGWFNAG